MSEPVGIGLVGAGAFGVFCLEAFADMPEVRIAAVADTDASRADLLAGRFGAAAYHSLEAILSDPAVEIVALNTPPFLHASQGLAALEAGKHLFCEKPLALTLADGEALIRAAEANNLRLTVDYVMRQNSYWKAAAALRRDGVLGVLRHMDLANHAAGLSLPPDHWFWDAGKSGGIWIEHGVHFFDAFAWVAGGGGEITSSAAYARADGGIDRVEALAHYGGAAAHFYHAFDQSGETEQTTVVLTFERGYVTLCEWVPTSIEILAPVSAEALQPYLPGVAEISARDGRTFAHAFAPEGKSSIYRACIQAGMRNLVQSISDPLCLLPVTGHEGLASLHMAVEASRAHPVT